VIANESLMLMDRGCIETHSFPAPFRWKAWGRLTEGRQACRYHRRVFRLEPGPPAEVYSVGTCVLKLPRTSERRIFKRRKTDPIASNEKVSSRQNTPGKCGRGLPGSKGQSCSTIRMARRLQSREKRCTEIGHRAVVDTIGNVTWRSYASSRRSDSAHSARE
jgi:hypothetical protein